MSLLPREVVVVAQPASITSSYPAPAGSSPGHLCQVAAVLFGLFQMIGRRDHYRAARRGSRRQIRNTSTCAFGGSFGELSGFDGRSASSWPALDYPVVWREAGIRFRILDGVGCIAL